jgi:hypothetical protein
MRLVTSGWTLTIVVVVTCHALWQAHGVTAPYFQNRDVAGIVYNARRILEGGLPYVDTFEIKWPGAFFLLTPAVALGGLRGVWVASILWGAALSLATGLLATALFGRRFGPRVALLHAAAAPLASLGDVNYSFWAATPFVASAACAALASGAAETGRRRNLWVLTGALAALATLIKHSSAALAILLVAIAVAELFRRRLGRVAEMAAFGVLGATLVFAGALAPYVVSDHVAAVVEAIRGSRTFGMEYVGIVSSGLGGTLPAAAIGAHCLLDFLPYGLALGAAGAIPAFGLSAAPDEDAAPSFILPVFATASFVGLASTLRFYGHDNVQLWPALCLIALRPGGLLGALIDRTGRAARWLPAAVPLALGLVVMARARAGLEMLQAGLKGSDRRVAALCDALGPRLPEGEPIFAWGWPAWGVYEHCGRRAPGRLYKALGSVTTTNTNTCNRGFGPPRLRPGPFADQLLSEIRTNPPALVLWSSYFERMGNDPLGEWPELSDMLAARYRPLQSDRADLKAYLRRDLLSPARIEVVSRR